MSAHTKGPHLLAQDRGASEAQDGCTVPTTPQPLITEEQCAAMDECSDFAMGAA